MISALLSAREFHVALGDVPTWGAFLGAGGAVYFTWKALGLERQRDKQASDDRRLEQASLVSAWIDIEPAFAGRSQIVIANLSSQPIYAVSVSVQPHMGQSFRTNERWVVPPSTTVEEPLWSKHPERKSLVREKDGPNLVPGYWEIVRDWRVAVSFRDASGSAWLRMPDGRLVGPAAAESPPAFE